MLTAYLQQQNRETPLESGEAAVSGLLAGVLGALIQVVIMTVLFSASGGMAGAEIEARLEENAQIPPEVRDQLIRVFAGPGILVVISAVVLPAYAVVGALGALLGRAIFRKTAPPPPAPEA
jgi:hypothetical protein